MMNKLMNFHSRVNPTLIAIVAIFGLAVLLPTQNIYCQELVKGGEPSDVVLRHTYVTITLDDAQKYEANYLSYISGLRGNYQNLDLSGVDITYSTVQAIEKQKSSRNAVMNQRGIIIVYGLANPGAAAADKQFYEMMFPIDYNGDRKTPKGQTIQAVKMPTQRESLSGSQLRSILNCPPYCD